MTTQPRVWMYDTTLRDGAQGARVSFSLPDKIKVAQLLDDFGIDYIEGGWPGSNPKDIEFFEQIKDVELKHAKVAAFGSTRRANISAEDDANLKQLVAAQTPVATIFGKSWLLHVTDVLRTTPEENVNMVHDSVAFLKANVNEVIYDAEHFFDGFKDNSDYALQTLEAAVKGGADWLILCDTNGGSLPEEIFEMTEKVSQTFEIPVGIHSHNDSGLGVANALASVRAGSRQIQGTINGYGERTGNANLCSIIPNLALKMDYEVLSDQTKLEQLTHMSRTISELANLEHDETLPFVGTDSFTHKGGTHVNAMMKTAESFEHIPPETVGNKRKYLVSELSGKSNILQKVEEQGLSLDDNAVATEVLEQLKELEHQGYQFEDADASFQLLVKRAQGELPSFFDLQHFHVHMHSDAGEKPYTTALIKICVKEKEVLESAEGDGPVSALDNAMRKALIRFYPEIESMKLIDYKVRILERERGTSAKPRVLITTSNGQDTWSTVGVAHDILEASWKALSDGYIYGLQNH